MAIFFFGTVFPGQQLVFSQLHRTALASDSHTIQMNITHMLSYVGSCQIVAMSDGCSCQMVAMSDVCSCQMVAHVRWWLMSDGGSCQIVTHPRRLPLSSKAPGRSKVQTLSQGRRRRKRIL